MALPPDTSDSFIREVDENLSRDQMAERAKRYGAVVVGAVVLFLLAIAAYLYWQDRQKKQAEAQTETLTTTLQDVGGGNAKAAQQQLERCQSRCEGSGDRDLGAHSLAGGRSANCVASVAEIAADTGMASLRNWRWSAARRRFAREARRSDCPAPAAAEPGCILRSAGEIRLALSREGPEARRGPIVRQTPPTRGSRFAAQSRGPVAG